MGNMCGESNCGRRFERVELCKAGLYGGVEVGPEVCSKVSRANMYEFVSQQRNIFRYFYLNFFELSTLRFRKTKK